MFSVYNLTENKPNQQQIAPWTQATRHGRQTMQFSKPLTFRCSHQSRRCDSFQLMPLHRKESCETLNDQRRPSKVLTFEDLNKKWKNRHKRNGTHLTYENVILQSEQLHKKLPDSGSTVDPAEPRSPKFKLSDLDIKSIVSISDDEEEARDHCISSNHVKVEESVIVIDFFKMENKSAPIQLQFDSSKTKAKRRTFTPLKIPDSS